MMTVVTELEQMLFNGYTKAKLELAIALLRKGILDPQMDWYETPQPTGMTNSPTSPLDPRLRACGFVTITPVNPLETPAEIRPYMCETLMCLVEVHAQVCSAAVSLLDRILNALVEELAAEAFRCIRQVKRFGMGGMLSVRFPLYSVHFLPPSAPERFPFCSESDYDGETNFRRFFFPRPLWK